MHQSEDKIIEIAENEWSKALTERLNQQFSNHDKSESQIIVENQKKLPYACEIYGYKDSENSKNITGETPQFEVYKTDILISDKWANGRWVPRVVIECKLGSVNTHEPLAYSAKAATHKHVHPYLRYGILVGRMSPLPRRLMRHGADFDFMVVWDKNDPSDTEWESFYQLLRYEIATARKLCDIFNGKTQPHKMLHKRLVFDEIFNEPSPQFKEPVFTLPSESQPMKPQSPIEINEPYEKAD